MKNLSLFLSCFLFTLTTHAQTTFLYSGTATHNNFGSLYKVAVVADNTNAIGVTSNQVGLIGYATNASFLNIGLQGTTRPNTVGTAVSHIAVNGDNYNNNLNINGLAVYGGSFNSKNLGSNSSIIGVGTRAEGSANTSSVTGVNATAVNSANVTMNRVIAIKGITTSGTSTSSFFLKGVSNPGGYFSSSDGQGVFGTTSEAYIFSGAGRMSQGVTGYSNITNAYVNAGTVGYAEGTGTYKFGIYGFVDGTAGTSNSAAVCGTDAINDITTYAGLFFGKVNINGNLTVNGASSATGVKTFRIDHPLDPENKILRHASMESNEVLNQYSGNVTTDALGYATVTLPNYFEVLNKDFRYQLTAIGSFAQAIIKQEVVDNQFIIQTNKPSIKVSWEITGVRNDKMMQYAPFVAETDKTAEEKGSYLSPEAYGKPLNALTIPAFGHKNAATPQEQITPQLLRPLDGRNKL